MQESGGEMSSDSTVRSHGSLFRREFKCLRVTALHYVLSAFQEAPPSSQIQVQGLRLAALSVWMLNAMIFRPPDYSSDRKLSRISALQYPAGLDYWEEDGMADGDELPEPALGIRGAYFVADIHVHDHFFYLPSLGPDDWGVSDIRAVFTLPAVQVNAAFLSRRARQQARVITASAPKARRMRRPQIVVREIAADAEVDVLPNLNLEASGVRFAPLETLPEPGAPLAAPPAPQHANIVASAEVDRAVQSILRQLCSNIVAVSPNRRRSGRNMYCTLSPEEQQQVDAALFRQTCLPFDTVQLKLAPITTWDTTFFDRFFPSQFDQDPSTRSRRQNFDKCSYFLEWEAVVTRLPPDDISKIRAELLPWWQTLTWLPYSAYDRMWDTRPWHDLSKTRLPNGSGNGPAPRIAVNERARVALRQFRLS